MTVCSLDDCDRDGIVRRGMCEPHYRAWRKAQPATLPPIPRPTGCNVDGCDGAHHADGMCGKHHMRRKRTGDPLKVNHFIRDPTERFWAMIDQDGPTPEHAPHLGPCWLYTGRLSVDGYARFGVDGRQTFVHRFAYELLVGPIPDGLTIDHLCFVTYCQNPAHMEPVTRAENASRMRNRDAATA